MNLRKAVNLAVTDIFFLETSFGVECYEHDSSTNPYNTNKCTFLLLRISLSSCYMFRFNFHNQAADTILLKDHHHHRHIPVMKLDHLLTRSGLTYPEVSSKVCHNSFCQLGNSVSLLLLLLLLLLLFFNRHYNP
jgi:hypothetical protein